MLAKKRQMAFQLLKWKRPEDGIAARLPDAYKKFRDELYQKQPKAVHYLEEPGKWKRDPLTNIVTPVQNIPLPTMFPRELNNTLLGGEMVIRGFQKRKPTRRRVAHFWTPHFTRSVVYSEILNKYFSVILTPRLILLIHEYKGFDNYLLQNYACDLRTDLALKIKRSLLLALSDKNLPYDEEKNREIYEKFKSYLIPKEEIEWYGLTYSEACRKQLEIEEKAYRDQCVPLKYKYRQLLLQELRSELLEKESGKEETSGTSSGWLSKLKSPFSSGSKS